MFVTILLVLSSLSGQPSASPLIGTTSQSLARFGSCFTGTQDQISHPWSFIPDEQGGTFTNEGAAGVTNPYLIRFRKLRVRNRIELIAPVSGAADQKSTIAAVKRCS